MSEWCDGGIHPNTNTWDLEVHEMGMFLILCIRVILKSLQELQESLLGDFTPSSFQISETREPEVTIQLMCYRIKWPPKNIPTNFQLRSLQGIALRVRLHRPRICSLA